MIRLLHRGAEVRHHRVADELVDGTAALQDAIGDDLEGLVQEGHDVLCLHAVGEVGEAPNVAEEDRDLALDAREGFFVGPLQELVEHVVVDVAPERDLDALLLLERITHLVEGAGERADLVARSRGHPHR